MTSRESLDRLFEYLRFPSISTQPEHSVDVRACAAWLSDFLNGIGLAAAVHESGGHPIVLARNSHRAGRRTVLLYGHYDVQPVDPPELWTSAPFEPVIRDGLIAARGATDNKGQTFAHLCGIASALEDGGELPVNLIVLLEGEEEIGSPSLPAFLENNREQLACDVVVISDTGMLGPGVPTLTYGLRGIAAMEIEVRGPAIDLHSGIFGGTIANPITAMARMLATLHNDHGAILVPGFCEAVRPIQAWEREAWAGLGHDAELLRVSGAPALAGEMGFTPTERIWARPTIEINGIGGGYQGEGTKTVLPARAFAKLTCRLVPDQNPDTALDLLEAHLRARQPGRCHDHAHPRAQWRGVSGRPAFRVRPGGAARPATHLRRHRGAHSRRGFDPDCAVLSGNPRRADAAAGVGSAGLQCPLAQRDVSRGKLRGRPKTQPRPARGDRRWVIHGGS